MSDNKRVHVYEREDGNFVLASDYDQLNAEYEKQKKQNEELRVMLSEKVIDSTMVTDFVVRNGGLNITLEGGACALLADALGKQLYESPAINYIEATFESRRYKDMGSIAVTLRRELGKTPHQLRLEAEQERDELKKRQSELILELTELREANISRA